MNFVHFIELLFILMILILVGLPLFGKYSGKRLFSDPDANLEEYKHLQVRKEEVLLSIKELEFDFKTDKLSQVDYDEMRAKLEREAVGILERMDGLEKLGRKTKKSAAQVST